MKQEANEKSNDLTHSSNNPQPPDYKIDKHTATIPLPCHWFTSSLLPGGTTVVDKVNWMYAGLPSGGAGTTEEMGALGKGVSIVCSPRGLRRRNFLHCPIHSLVRLRPQKALSSGGRIWAIPLRKPYSQQLTSHSPSTDSSTGLCPLEPALPPLPSSPS